MDNIIKTSLKFLVMGDFAMLFMSFKFGKVLNFIFFVHLLFLGSMFLFGCNKQSPKKGVIVWLNGASSSGKSSISREFIKLRKDFVGISLDASIHQLMLDALIKNDSTQKKMLLSLKEGVDDNKLMGIWDDTFSEEEQEDILSERKKQIKKETGCEFDFGLVANVEKLARAGKNVIVDTYISNKENLDEIVARIAEDYTVVFVGIYAPLEELKKREKLRGNRVTGNAESQYKRIHAHGLYDLIIDSSSVKPEKTARIINNYLKLGVQPQAFKLLMKKGYNCLTGAGK